MKDGLNGITIFVQVADAGSFAAAAKRLNLSRSAVGKAVAALERRLGARLFHRTTRQQSLTDAGQAFYERCVRALAEVEAGEAELASHTREPRGRLRVSAPVLFGRTCVLPVLLDLTREHPRLSLEMTFSDSVVDLVAGGFDLAVRVGALPDSASLTARRLGTQQMAICAAPSYLERHGQPKSVDELAMHAVIVCSRFGQDVPWLVRDGDGGVWEPNIDARLRFDDLQAIADAAIAGAGLAWLPRWLLSRHLAAGELELTMDSERVLAKDVHAVWPRTRYMPSKTRAAIDALAARLPALLGAYTAPKMAPPIPAVLSAADLAERRVRRRIPSS
jgi:DNA-binding transcriptional LysR family regulator